MSFLRNILKLTDTNSITFSKSFILEQSRHKSKMSKNKSANVKIAIHGF